MDSRERNFLLVGALLAGGAAGIAYFYNKTKEEQMAQFRPRTVPRKLIVRILKEVQREMFGVLTSVAMITTQIKEQYKGRITPDEIKDFLLEHNTQTKEQMKRISDSLCRKYGVSEYELKYACENTYREDQEIQKLLEEAKATFDRAFMGAAPDLKTEIPEFLTPELTLKILQKIMKESVFRIQEFLQNLKEKGISIACNDSQVLMGIQNLKLDDLRKEILVQEGLDKFKSHPLKIFQYAIQKYSTQDIDSFNNKIMKLEIQNQRAMDALMKDELNAPMMIEAIGVHLINESEEIVASKRLQTNKAYKASVAARKAETALLGAEDEESIDFNKNIRDLQHDVSYQLNKQLDDSGFPELLLESAVNSVFPVFTNMKKDNTNQDTSVISTAGANAQDRTFVTAKSEEVAIERVENLVNNSEVPIDQPEVPEVDDAQAQQIKEEDKNGNEESGFVTIEESNLEKEV